MLKVALLGAGLMGETHAAAYQAVEGCRLHRIYNRSEDRGRALAEQTGAQYVATLDQIFADPAIDVVDVCLPTFLHEEVMIRAAESNKHILCEKPFVLDLEQGRRVLEAVHRHGVKLMVAHVLRFWPEYRVIRETITRGAIGRPRMAKATRLGERPAWGEWFKDPALSGGALLDLQIHDLDFLTWLFGKPRQLYARGVRSALGAWDHVMTMLHYDSGVSAYCEGSVMMPEGYPFTMSLTITGTEGAIDFRFRASQGNVENRDLAARQVVLYQQGYEPQVLAVPREDPFSNEIAYFVDAVNNGKAIDRITEAEVLTVLDLIGKSRESLETGRVIDVD